MAQRPCRHCRQIDLSQQDGPAAAECAYAVDEALVHLFDSGIDSEEEKDRDEDESDGDLGGYADAEPDHEQRRENDPGHGVHHRHRGIEDLAHTRQQRRGRTERSADNDAEQESKQGRAESRLDMRPDFAVGEEIKQRSGNFAGRGHVERIERSQPDERFPQAQYERQRPRSAKCQS